MKVAAREAFWDLKLDYLHALCEHVDVDDITRSSGLFDTLFAMVSTTLELDEAKTLDILVKRLCRVDDTTQHCTDALLTFDYEIGHLAAEDAKDLEGSKKSAKRKGKVAQEFQAAWVGKRKSLGPDGPKLGDAAKWAKGNKLFSKYPPYPKSMPSQRDAAKLAPPGCAVWRGLANGSWQYHLKPHPRRSFSWMKHGSPEQSCRVMLQSAWELYLMTMGLPKSLCPVPDLWPKVAELSASSGASKLALPAPVAPAAASASSSSSTIVPA